MLSPRDIEKGDYVLHKGKDIAKVLKIVRPEKDNSSKKTKLPAVTKKYIHYSIELISKKTNPPIVVKEEDIEELKPEEREKQARDILVYEGIFKEHDPKTLIKLRNIQYNKTAKTAEVPKWGMVSRITLHVNQFDFVYFSQHLLSSFPSNRR